MLSWFRLGSSSPTVASLATQWHNLPIDVKCLVVAFVSIKQSFTELVTVSHAMEEIVTRGESHRRSALKLSLHKPFTLIRAVQNVGHLRIEHDATYPPNELSMYSAYLVQSCLPQWVELEEIHLDFICLSSSSTPLISLAFRSLTKLSHISMSGVINMTHLSVICGERSSSIMTLALPNCAITHADWRDASLVHAIQPLSQLRQLQLPLVILSERRPQRRVLIPKVEHENYIYEALAATSPAYHPDLQFITTSATLNATDLSALSCIESLTALDMSAASNFYISGIEHIRVMLHLRYLVLPKGYLADPNETMLDAVKSEAGIPNRNYFESLGSRAASLHLLNLYLRHISGEDKVMSSLTGLTQLRQLKVDWNASQELNKKDLHMHVLLHNHISTEIQHLLTHHQWKHLHTFHINADFVDDSLVALLVHSLPLLRHLSITGTVHLTFDSVIHLSTLRHLVVLELAFSYFHHHMDATTQLSTQHLRSSRVSTSSVVTSFAQLRSLTVFPFAQEVVADLNEIFHMIKPLLNPQKLCHLFMSFRDDWNNNSARDIAQEGIYRQYVLSLLHAFPLVERILPNTVKHRRLLSEIWHIPSAYYDTDNIDISMMTNEYTQAQILSFSAASTNNNNTKNGDAFYAPELEWNILFPQVIKQNNNGHHYSASFIRTLTACRANFISALESF